MCTCFGHTCSNSSESKHLGRDIALRLTEARDALGYLFVQVFTPERTMLEQVYVSFGIVTHSEAYGFPQLHLLPLFRKTVRRPRKECRWQACISSLS